MSRIHNTVILLENVEINKNCTLQGLVITATKYRISESVWMWRVNLVVSCQSVSIVSLFVYRETGQLGKRLTTGVTPVRLLTCMNPHVCGETAGMGKRLTTGVTPVRLLTCMNLPVSSENVGLAKRLTTGVTPVRLLTSMNPPVCGESAGAAKCLTTGVTPVRLLTCMNPPVCDESAGLPKHLVADTALILTFTRVTVISTHHLPRRSMHHTCLLTCYIITWHTINIIVIITSNLTTKFNIINVSAACCRDILALDSAWRCWSADRVVWRPLPGDGGDRWPRLMNRSTRVLTYQLVGAELQVTHPADQPRHLCWK